MKTRMFFCFFLKDYSTLLTNFIYDIISVYIPKDPTLVVPKLKGGDGGAVGVDNVRLWKHQEQLKWQSQLISLDQSLFFVCVSAYLHAHLSAPFGKGCHNFAWCWRASRSSSNIVSGAIVSSGNYQTCFHADPETLELLSQQVLTK